VERTGVRLLPPQLENIGGAPDFKARAAAAYAAQSAGGTRARAGTARQNAAGVRFPAGNRTPAAHDGDYDAGGG
jgi:hypothetical protein